MSFHFDWKAFKESLSALKHTLNTQLQTLHLQGMKELHIDNLGFGDIQPQLEIIEVRALEGFYDKKKDMFTSDSMDTEILLDFGYEDSVNVAISLKLSVDMPTPSFIQLPISIHLTMLNIKGRLSVMIIGGKTQISIQDYSLDFEFESRIGDANKNVMKNVDKVDAFVHVLIKTIIDGLAKAPNAIKM